MPPFPAIPPRIPLPGQGAHRSQPDLFGQHGLADKPERGTQQTLGKPLSEGQIWSRLVAKPRHLALRVSPGRLLPRSDCSLEGDLTTQMTQNRRYANRLHRRQIWIETAASERRRFAERVCFDHP